LAAEASANHIGHDHRDRLRHHRTAGVPATRDALTIPSGRRSPNEKFKRFRVAKEIGGRHAQPLFSSATREAYVASLSDIHPPPAKSDQT